MGGNKAALLCPYDAELFGHWWFEGPLFLEAMLERAASSSVLEFAGADDVMISSADPDAHEPAFSSWGEGGFASVWINPETEKYYPQSYRIRSRIDLLKHKVSKVPDTELRSLMDRYVRQMERELMLFQASDWAFMIHNHSTEDYARRRLESHYLGAESLFGEACMVLAESKGKNLDKLDIPVLTELESNDNIFSK